LKRSRSSTGATTRRTTRTAREGRPVYPAPRKRFAQHFLEPVWVARLVDAFAPNAQDTFLEIGPGRGALTRALAPRVARLVCIEIDRDLAAALIGSMLPHVQVITADILDTDIPALARDLGGGPVRVAGNLPYNISSPILFALLRAADEGRSISDATLMLQKEVADRVAASPGDREYGALAVQVARVADVDRLLDLPPGAFRPAPKVSSAVVRLRFRQALPADPVVFERIVRGVFTQRRKTMLRALAPVAVSLSQSAPDLLARAGIDPRLRPEQLSAEAFARLAGAVL
jgi:16S rRNA (adenine1518-N6/adenine1519-N6)-dimethyltransferase